MHFCTQHWGQTSDVGGDLGQHHNPPAGWGGVPATNDFTAFFCFKERRLVTLEMS